MLIYRLDRSVRKDKATTQLRNEVDKHIYESVDVFDRYSPGIFDHLLIDSIIKSYIHELPTRKRYVDKVSFEDLCNEIFKDHDTKRRYDWFVPIIAERCDITEESAEQHVLLRAYQIFVGVVGEAIFELLIDNSDRLKLVKMNKSRDYKDHVDVLVKDTNTKDEVYFQIKKSSFYYNPTDWHKSKIEDDARVHEDKGLKCEFAFFHYDFDNRHFIINDKPFNFRGYGRSESTAKKFEEFLIKEVFPKHHFYI
ncbi:hypothetical protein [Priestia megaterium]|uniref:hypothetical protein n=1 Tax=Priestia megaterium TaxID=1404 RepID=UPI001142C475|nr:hypothetical protein [Priestia megaterium]